jgi:heme exporter protein D
MNLGTIARFVAVAIGVTFVVMVMLFIVTRLLLMVV